LLKTNLENRKVTVNKNLRNVQNFLRRANDREIKNPGRGVGTAGIARKWEGERRIQANPVDPLSVHPRICLPDREDVRFNIARGKWEIMSSREGSGWGNAECRVPNAE
jgi:hypothetical protein